MHRFADVYVRDELAFWGCAASGCLNYRHPEKFDQKPSPRHSSSGRPYVIRFRGS